MYSKQVNKTTERRETLIKLDLGPLCFAFQHIIRLARIYLQTKFI